MKCTHCGYISFVKSKKCGHCGTPARKVKSREEEAVAGFTIFAGTAAPAVASGAESAGMETISPAPAQIEDTDTGFVTTPVEEDAASDNFELDLSEVDEEANEDWDSETSLEDPSFIPSFSEEDLDEDDADDLDSAVSLDVSDEIEVEGLGFDEDEETVMPPTSSSEETTPATLPDTPEKPPAPELDPEIEGVEADVPPLDLDTPVESDEATVEFEESDFTLDPQPPEKEPVPPADPETDLDLEGLELERDDPEDEPRE